jgi:D-cysteine desulfhydrase family pyridoxal phosphate-dependent enzyme
MPSLTHAFARTQIAHLPTPLERLSRLEAALELTTPVYIKRDDCTGMATGGNKVRQLEFYFGDALEKGATRILITGAVQSNFVRTAAGFAARLGLKCTVQLEDRVAGKDASYHNSGNVLLDRLFGAEITRFDVGEDEFGADRSLEAMAQAAREAGEVPYVIHLSETPRPLGALGYVVAAEELLADAERLGIDIGTVVVPSGSASTHAGTLVGLRAAGRADIRVLGTCVRRLASEQGPRVQRVCSALETMMGLPPTVEDADVNVSDATFEGGYGVIGDSTREAMRLGAQLEALVLDPVYTAKGFAGLLHHLRAGTDERAVVFIHTGGLPALFAYGDSVFEG